MKTRPTNAYAKGLLSWVVMLGLSAVLLFNAQKTISTTPDPCCSYFTKNDQLAFQWIAKHKTSHSLFVISSFKSDGKTYETDAGMWIAPLANMAVNRMFFDTDWKSPQVFDQVCSRNDNKTYIYVSGERYSFDAQKLEDDNLYHPVFRSGEVVIYQTAKCQM